MVFRSNILPASVILALAPTTALFADGGTVTLQNLGKGQWSAKLVMMKDMPFPNHGLRVQPKNGAAFDLNFDRRVFDIKSDDSFTLTMNDHIPDGHCLICGLELTDADGRTITIGFTAWNAPGTAETKAVAKASIYPWHHQGKGSHALKTDTDEQVLSIVQPKLPVGDTTSAAPDPTVETKGKN